MVSKIKSDDMLNINVTYGCVLSLSKTIEQIKKNESISGDDR
jgi:hypothetical protein